MAIKLHLRKAMRLSFYSCFRVALQKSQVMTSFCPPPMYFPGGATGVELYNSFHFLASKHKRSWGERGYALLNFKSNYKILQRKQNLEFTLRRCCIPIYGRLLARVFRRGFLNF